MAKNLCTLVASPQKIILLVITGLFIRKLISFAVWTLLFKNHNLLIVTIYYKKIFLEKTFPRVTKKLAATCHKTICKSVNNNRWHKTADSENKK